MRLPMRLMAYKTCSLVALIGAVHFATSRLLDLDGAGHRAIEVAPALALFFGQLRTVSLIYAVRLRSCGDGDKCP